MKALVARLRTAIGALVLCCAMLPLLDGCAIPFFHHRNKDAGCREKPFSLNTDNRPPLKVPDGMDAPDTRSAIKVPELDTPERVRAKNEPCLSRPPDYFGGSISKPAPTTGALPQGAPLPTPSSLPAPVPAPTPTRAPDAPK
ncbi:MAG TPA: hypothetical protein VHZ99_08725 [Steroidobacteraceae bacterium]|nr:hypothetical protein [Steroidobacteraceae bacterium]